MTRGQRNLPNPRSASQYTFPPYTAYTPPDPRQAATLSTPPDTPRPSAGTPRWALKSACSHLPRPVDTAQSIPGPASYPLPVTPPAS